jgi:uncharacterized membrane protein YgcG
MKFRSRPRGRALPLTLVAAVLISTSPMVTGCSRGEDQPAAAPSSAQAEPSVVATAVPAPPAPAAAEEPGPPPGAASPQELQELVSPIALYPDVLVAQILAGSTYPTQVVEADRWLKQNPNLSGDQLAAQVNQQEWDPSIKSLTQFPSVLQTMNDSLAWTSALGEAYYNQPADVMNAIQVLRNMAVNSGTLKSTAQQQIEVQPAPPAAQGSAQPSVQQTVIIQPAQPNTVYVPQYNPTTAYGAPVPAPAGYTGSDLLLTGVLSFGAGILLGSLINNGNNNWGCSWHGGSGYSSSVKYNNNVYVTNNNVYPGRPPGAGYPGYRPPAAGYPGYRPPAAGYPRPGYPAARPMPYPATRPAYNGGSGIARPNNGAIPSTRPYNPTTARPANPNIAQPNFPKASTLPNNPAGSNLASRDIGKNRPGQPSNPVAANRPANSAAGNRPAATKPANRAADPARGFAKDNGSAGGRNSALGGYEPGGNARASSDRGQASVKGNQKPAGGRGNGGGGGNAKRAAGSGNGGGGGNRGGGGNPGGRRKGN